MSTSIFSLPLPDIQQRTVKRQKQGFGRKRKRKLTDGRVTSEEAQDSGDDELFRELPNLPSSSQVEYLAVISPEQRTQFRLAGHPLDEKVPQPPFPHAAQAKLRETQDSPVGSGTSSWISEDTTPSTRAAASPTLHLQHLAAITAVLHRCLMEHDYDRAARALGLVLRDRVGGRIVDLRNDSRWGIGAEVLLRRGTERDEPQEAEHDSSTAAPGKVFCTDQGWEDAKKYYERLIIQHPFHKPNAGAVNALDFYPAFFSLWIYVAHEEGKTETDDARSSASAKPLATALRDAREKELDQARAIASRMDVCMSTVPYNDSRELIRLRGMVALWTVNLISAGETADPVSVESGENMREQEPMGAVTEDVTRMNISGDDEASGTSQFALRMEASSCRQMAQDLFDRLNAAGRG